jgi:tetratricopeptide (TPR) repeat protein
MVLRRAALLAAVAVAILGCASDDAEELGLEVYLHNAQGYAEGGHWDQALTQFRRALEIDPSHRKALLGEATSLYWLGMGETPAAGPAIQEAEAKIGALDPGEYGDQGWKVRLTAAMIDARLADLWSRKADRARAPGAAGDPAAREELRAAEAAARLHDDRAAERFREVLAEEGDPLARNNLTALVYLATRAALRASGPEAYEEALAYFRRYEAELGKSKDLWIAMKKREPEYANLYDLKLRAAESQEVPLRDLIANIHYKRREHDASLRELDRILAIDPRRARTWLARAQNHEETGRFGDAADDYRRFLELTDLPAGSADVVRAVDRMALCERKARGGEPE